MAVLTAKQVVSESMQKAVNQRRVFREKRSVGTPRPLKKSLPPVPQSAAASFKKYEASVVDIKRAVDTKQYLQSQKDDKHAYECWLASYAQFGDDPSMERKATIIRNNKPDKKSTVNKVFACWLEPGDRWGDPDSTRHKDGTGYPTRDKYEQRSSYSTYVRRRLQVHVNPSQEMLKTVWDRSMSRFSHLHPAGCEWIHRPPTVNELLAQTWPRTGLFQTVLEQTVPSVDNVFDGRYATPASNDEIKKWEKEDRVSSVGTERIKVRDSVSQQEVVYDPIEYHREAEKRYIWFLCNSPKKAEVDGKQYKSVSDSWKREKPIGFVGPLLPFKLYADSGFSKWSREVESKVSHWESYERYWLNNDERRYQMTLASMPNDPRRRITPRRRVDDSHDGLLNFWEYQARVGRAGPEMAERIRVLKSLKEGKAERLRTVLEGSPVHPVVPVGKPYGDWDEEVKKMSVRFQMHPERVATIMKAVERESPMSTEEYDEITDITPKDSEISGAADSMLASYTSDLGVKYVMQSGLLVPEHVVRTDSVVLVQSKRTRSKREEEPAIETVLRNGTFSAETQATPRRRNRYKTREEMTLREKVVDTLKSVGILSV